MNRVEVVEQFISSKSPRAEDCEDAISIGDDFFAVVDGATSKTKRKWKGETPGRTAALLLADAVQRLPPSATAGEAIKFLTDEIRNTYVSHRLRRVVEDDPSQRISASIAIFSLARKEVWMVGDCQAIIGEELISQQKLIDQLLSAARSLFLEVEIRRGRQIKELLEDDTGREFILPLLERQMYLQNKPETGEYWYPVLDGSPVPDSGIRVFRVQHSIHNVVLASDGYPYLRSGLSESEEALQQVISADPLLFREFKSTKGVQPGDNSFDDRAYLKLRVGRD